MEAGFLPLGLGCVCPHLWTPPPPTETHTPRTHTHTHRWTHTPATVNKLAVRILLESFLVLFCVNYLPDTVTYESKSFKRGAQCQMVPRRRTRYIWPHVEMQHVIKELGCGKIKKKTNTYRRNISWVEIEIWWYNCVLAARNCKRNKYLLSCMQTFCCYIVSSDQRLNSEYAKEPRN